MKKEDLGEVVIYLLLGIFILLGVASWILNMMGIRLEDLIK